MNYFTPRWILCSYAIGGLFVGCILAVVFHWHSLGRGYRHADGSVTDSPVRTVSRTYPGFTTSYAESIRDGRPLTSNEMISLGAQNTCVFALVPMFVGLVWGLVHVYFRATKDLRPQVDQNFLDYGDSTNQNLPPAST